MSDGRDEAFAAEFAAARQAAAAARKPQGPPRDPGAGALAALGDADLDSLVSSVLTSEGQSVSSIEAAVCRVAPHLGCTGPGLRLAALAALRRLSASSRCHLDSYRGTESGQDEWRTDTSP